MKNDTLLLILLGVGIACWYNQPAAVVPHPKPVPVAPVPEPSKPVVYMFSGESCPWCKKFESQVLSKPEVKDALNRFDFRIINTDVDKELPRQYNVTGLPTFVIVSTNKRHAGYMDQQEFLKWLK